MTPEEIAAFEACKSEGDWNALCNKLKASRDGQYPPDWWTVMKVSGRMARIVAGFGGSTEIRIRGL